MSHSNTAARLLTDHLSLLQSLTIATGVLDLACGTGRNGLVLARQQIPVTFADNNEAALATVNQQSADEHLPTTCWQVDLESGEDSVLAGKQFDAVLVFNYLHRQLFPEIKRAIRPGGLLFYETFTEAQREFGRPSNANFLLRSGELEYYFNDWEVLHNYEGELTDPQRAVAQLIARKPN